MRKRWLSLTLFSGLFVGIAHAELSMDEYSSLTLKERNLVQAYMNAFPVIGIPRIGESGRETMTAVEKYQVFNKGALKPFLSVSCTTSITTNSTVINIDDSSYYLYQTQSIKMSPRNCAYDEEGGVKGLDSAFGLGKKSRITKVPLMGQNDLAYALSNWITWSISGKNVKYSWFDNSEPNYVLSDSGVVNLGAANALCSFSTSTFTAKGQEDLIDDPESLEVTGTVKFDTKYTSSNVCLGMRPVFAKARTDIMSLSINEETEYCVDDYEGDILNCLSTAEEHEEGTFPQKLLPSIPSLVVEEAPAEPSDD